MCVLQDKCCQYWPTEDSVKYGDYTVEIKADTQCDDTFSLRDLVLTYDPVCVCVFICFYRKEIWKVYINTVNLLQIYALYCIYPSAI